MRSGSPFYHFRSKQELLKAAMIEGLEAGYQRLQAAIAGIVDPEQRLRVMIRTHLGNLLEGDCQAPMLLYESRSLDAAARAEIAAVSDRYSRPWQATLDELAASGRLRSSAATAAVPFRHVELEQPMVPARWGTVARRDRRSAADLLLG
jgi:AcrR family transcriptional regulator